MASTNPAPARLASVDALRGFAVAGMVLVNDPGDPNSVVGWLQHAGGHGMSLADLVFPLFLFVVGASVALSIGPARDRVNGGPPELDRSAAWRRIWKRTGLLLALGFALNVVLELPYFDLRGTRLPGVLQRIALCYLAAAAAALLLDSRTRLVTALALVCGYGLLLRFTAAPAYPIGQLDDPAGTLPAYVDRLLFGDRLWKGTWDPEGLLSTLPAIASTLFGIVAVERMRAAADERQRIRVLKVGAAAALIAGSVIGEWQPVDKNLWTPAFTLLTTGLALVALLVCVLAIDVRGDRVASRPLVWLGANPLLVYLGSAVLGQLLAILPAADPRLSARGWLMQHAFGWLSPPATASLAYALVMLAFWTAIARSLYHRRIFVRL